MSLPLSEVDSMVVRKANTAVIVALVGGIAALGLISCLTSDCGTGLGD